MDVQLPDPRRLVCEDCRAEWFSRLADQLVALADLGRCVLCRGRLMMADDRAEPGRV